MHLHHFRKLFVRLSFSYFTFWVLEEDHAYLRVDLLLFLIIARYRTTIEVLGDGLEDFQDLSEGISLIFHQICSGLIGIILIRTKLFFSTIRFIPP